MYRYRLYELALASDLEFLQLVAGSGADTVDVEIAEGVITDNTECRFAIGREISRLSNRTCRLLVTNGNRITYARKEGCNEEYLKTYILGWGMAMLALQRENLAIHCSAVADERGAFLIAGESGAGKSTVTTAFLERGYRLLADDMAFVEVRGADEEGAKQAYVKPAFPYQKLCRDVAVRQGYHLEELLYIDEEKDKFLAPYRGTFKTEAVPLTGFIILAELPVEAVVAEEIRGIQKLSACAGNLFLRHLLGQGRYEPYIGQMCLAMASVVPIYRIVRPVGEDTVQEVIEKAFAVVDAIARPQEG